MQKINNWLANNRNVYFLICSLFIVDRIILLTGFSFRFVGDDDLIFWNAANDYMHGVFHEPYFYGQNYNFMLESVVAIPLLKCGIPYMYALPVSSAFLALFPFLLFSYVLFRKSYFIESLIFLIIPLCLPVEYGILTSVTRGFVSGLFFCAFFIFPLLKPAAKSSWIIAAAAFSLGYIFNPNSLVFSLPVCLYLVLLNFRKISFYLVSICVILPVLLIEFFAKKFYTDHPEYKVNSMWEIHFDFHALLNNLQHLDNYFTYFTPVVWFAGWLVLVLILIAGIRLLKSEWQKGVALIFGVVFIIFSLGINKVSDHIDSLFLSSTRMFLGIPLLAALAFSWYKQRITLPEKQLKQGLIIIAVCTFCIKISVLPAVIKLHTTKINYGPVAIKRTDRLLDDSSKLNDLAKKENINLIVFVRNDSIEIPALEFFDYGSPLLEKDFPATLLSLYETRTWVYLKEKSAVEKNVLIYGSDLDEEKIKEIKNARIISNSPKMVVITGNTMRTDALLQSLHIDFRRTTY